MNKIFLIFLVCAAFLYPQQDNGNASSGLLYIYNQKPAGSGGGAVTYLYYKFVITAWNDATWAGSAEMAMYGDVANFGNVGTANGQLNVHTETGTLTSTIVGSAGAEVVPYAMNGVATSAGDFLFTPTATVTITFQFNTAQSVAGYSIWSANSGARFPKTWTLEASNNGTDWTVVDTQTNVTAPALSYTAKNFTIP